MGERLALTLWGGGGLSFGAIWIFGLIFKLAKRGFNRDSVSLNVMKGRHSYQSLRTQNVR